MKLRLIVVVALVFCIALLASAMLEAHSVIRSFHATDALFVNLRQSLEQEDLMAHCRELQAVRSQDDLSGLSTDADQALAARGAAAGLSVGETAKLIVAFRATQATSLNSLCSNLQTKVGVLRQEYDALQATRLSWQSTTYKMLLATSNLVAFMLILAIALAILYTNGEASAMRRIDRARRAVLQTERRHAGFLAAAGHDLRQPLQALRLFLSVLLQRQLDAESRAIGVKIDAAAGSMQRMIGSLVDIAKLDAGLVAADRRDVPLADLFRSFAEEFDQLAHGSGLTFSVEQTDAVVHTDPDLLERILRNLISNAIKYTRKGGVVVRVRYLQRRVTIAVHDTGLGIRAERLDNVFDDFFRVEPSSSDGLGLGLGIVRRLSTLLDAPVSVNSTFGTGSVFSVNVPLSAREALPRSLPGPASPAANMPRMTALVVDDNEAVRNALGSQLMQWDMQVVEAADYGEARMLATGPEAASINLIITDYDLGDGTGLQLLQELERSTGQRPCALIITGTSCEAAWQQLRHCDYVCLQKPIDPRRLEQEVSRLRACAMPPAHAHQSVRAGH